MEPTEITAEEAAQILGVLARQVRWYHAKGHLTGRRIGARVLVFKRKDVEKLAENKPKRTGRPKEKPEAKAPAKKKSAAKRKGKTT